VPLSGDRALSIKPWRLYENGAWSVAPGEPLPELATHGRVHALSDGSFLAFGRPHGVLAHRIHRDGTVQRLGDLPEPRAYDEMVVLPDGRLWFGGGEARGEQYFGTTRRTVILDPATWTFSAGPELPEGVFHRGAFFGGHGRAMVLRSVEGGVGVSIWDGQRWSEPQISSEIAQGISAFHVLNDGTVLSVRWPDGAIVTFAPGTFEVRIAGHVLLSQDGARVHELTDGRVLFIGGNLFGNVPAEPEVWDRATGVCVPLEGREKDAERQRKQLAKYHEKREAEAARSRAQMAEQAAARAAKAAKKTS
jgi:hypothetical protein